MALSAVSFSLYYHLYRWRRLDALLDRELLVYLSVMAGAVCSCGACWSSRGSTRTPGAWP
jgi:Trk-type K+ transport system membrane component